MSVVTSNFWLTPPREYIGTTGIAEEFEQEALRGHTRLTIDVAAVGTATAGTYQLYGDFGVGYRPIGSQIDLTDMENNSEQVFDATFKKLKGVPTGVAGATGIIIAIQGV